MSTAAPDKLITPEELLAMPDGILFELVGGELVERNMGLESSWIGGEVSRRLGNHCAKHQLGCVFPADAGYRCFADDPDKVRKPDVSFVSIARLPAGQIPQGFATVPPDLAVEVVSPNDLFEEVTEKVAEYLAAGVQLVWVVDPAQRAIHVYRADGSTVVRRSGDEITGEQVVPGFRCRVADLFPAVIPRTRI